MHIIKTKTGIITPIKTKRPGEENAKPKMQITTPIAIAITTARVPFPIPAINSALAFSSSSEAQFIKLIKHDKIKKIWTYLVNFLVRVI